MKQERIHYPWEQLILWYREHGRHDLPWRQYDLQDTDIPYRVWISEIFLQQTQVSRVCGYFERVIERFPTVTSLSETDYETFFPYYQGLGYYSRARNILKTASLIREEYAGVFPRNKSALQILPGVGEYTARAILAFGYGEPYLAWDTNLEKVFARYYHGTKYEKLTEAEKEMIQDDFRKYIDAGGKQGNGGSGGETVGAKMIGEKGGAKQEGASFLPTEVFGTFDSKSTASGISRTINNALMDFASIVDLKNHTQIDWDHYPIQSGIWYETRGTLEPLETKSSTSFPTPDAIIVVILHENHKIYFSENSESYSPFLLPPSLTRDTRSYVQTYFREHYGLELSVRPAHKKWLTTDGQPYIAVNAQIQTGKQTWREYTKKEAEEILKTIIA